MKNNKLIALILLVAVVFSSMASGCTLSRQTENSAQQINIGMTLYRQDDTFISLIQQRFEATAKAREAQYNIKITINVMDGKGNQSIQNEQVDKFLAQGYDVICVNCVDRTAASVIIDKAKAVGIPVVFFNREPVQEDIQRWDQVYYVGSIARRMGEMEGKLVVDAYEKDPEGVDRNQDGKLQYVMLEGEAGHQDSLIRTEYSVKALTSSLIGVEKLANYTANWQRSQGSAKMAQWIESFGNRIEVVFCNNDDMALGAIDAYQAIGMTDLPIIVGVDATPAAIEAIRNGTLTGTVLNNYTDQATIIFELACALASGNDPKELIPELDGHYFWSLPKTYTADNIDEYP